ncbi:MAG: hypothetical protein H6Q73_4271 [Firmicutes bacterium]|nr:hypothetical protein [Bacillota bacterium]
MLDLANATDITGLKIEGQEPEFISDASKLEKIHFADKELIYDLRANGWEAEKAEGLTMLPDRKTIVVTNDNDFGLRVKVDDSAHPGAEIDDYTVKVDGKFLYKGKPAKPHIHKEVAILSPLGDFEGLL